jgi:hypothetical protein
MARNKGEGITKMYVPGENRPGYSTGEKSALPRLHGFPLDLSQRFARARKKGLDVVPVTSLVEETSCIALGDQNHRRKCLD